MALTRGLARWTGRPVGHLRGLAKEFQRSRGPAIAAEIPPLAPRGGGIDSRAREGGGGGQGPRGTRVPVAGSCGGAGEGVGGDGRWGWKGSTRGHPAGTGRGLASPLAGSRVPCGYAYGSKGRGQYVCFLFFRLRRRRGGEDAGSATWCGESPGRTPRTFSPAGSAVALGVGAQEGDETAGHSVQRWTRAYPGGCLPAPVAMPRGQVETNSSFAQPPHDGGAPLRRNNPRGNFPSYELGARG